MARLVYLGTPESAVPTLEALGEGGHDIVLVVTQPDRRRARGSKTIPSPVSVAAQVRGIPVTHRVRDVLTVEADYGVVVSFGKLIKTEVLAHLSFLNIHPSLLPRWRGATPVESAILAGDVETGVCLMSLDEGMDTGPVYERMTTKIGEHETASELSERLLASGTAMLLKGLSDGLPEPMAQQGQATYAKKLTPEDLHIEWSSPAEEISRQVRVGRAWTTFRSRRLIIHRAEPNPETAPGDPGAIEGLDVVTGNGVLTLMEVQPEGKAAMAARSWINGLHMAENERLV